MMNFRVAAATIRASRIRPTRRSAHGGRRPAGGRGIPGRGRSGRTAPTRPEPARMHSEAWLALAQGRWPSSGPGSMETASDEPTRSCSECRLSSRALRQRSSVRTSRVGGRRGRSVACSDSAMSFGIRSHDRGGGGAILLVGVCLVLWPLAVACGSGEARAGAEESAQRSPGDRRHAAGGSPRDLRLRARSQPEYRPVRGGGSGSRARDLRRQLDQRLPRLDLHLALHPPAYDRHALRC